MNAQVTSSQEIAAAPTERATTTSVPFVVRRRSRYRFALTFMMTFVALLVAMFWINIAGNSTGLFPSQRNPSMAERAWKTRRVDDAVRRGREPGVMIMGSSRVMQIQPAYVEGMTKLPTFNYGVSAAGPIDFLAQLRYLIGRNYAPKMIVIGLDESAFSDVTSKYELQSAGHWGLFKELPFPENLNIAGRVLSNVTPDTTWASLNVLAHPPQRPNKSIKRAGSLLLEDGYIIYRDRVLAAESGTYDREQAIRKSARKWTKAMTGDEAEASSLEPQPRRVELFRQFLELAHTHHIEVKAMYLPLHPEFERIGITPKMQEARDRLNGILRDLCQQYGATYRDFRKLDSFGADPKEFWDGAHLTPENMRRMVNALFDKPPGQVVAKFTPDRKTLDGLPKVTTLNTW